MSSKHLAIVSFALSAALMAGAPAGGSADVRHFTLEEGVRLGADMEAAMARLAAEFHARTGRGLHVTSGTRSPEEQADAMYDKLRLGQRLTRLYIDYDAAAEIEQAYAGHRRQGRGRCVSAMARVIERQVRRGRFISRHLRASAADVRSRDMNRRERRIFERLVAEERDLSLLQEGTPPHFHLQLR